MKTALVVLDMLNDFVDGTLANSAAVPIIDPIGQLADAARGRDDWVVVYANDAHKPGDVEFEVFGEHALAGSVGAEVVPGLSPQGDDLVVPKRFYSAFTETDLDATCRVHNIGKMVIVGQHTNCCCRHTTYDAFLRGNRSRRGVRCDLHVRPDGRRPVRRRSDRGDRVPRHVLQLPGGRDKRPPLAEHRAPRSSPWRCATLPRRDF